jgi:hypothetical protein
MNEPISPNHEEKLNTSQYELYPVWQLVGMNILKAKVEKLSIMYS